jgi:anti-sigma B factor antagonist
VGGFELSTRHDGAASIISIHGDLDMAAAPVLLAAATNELASPTCELVTLDLTGLEFLDSTGLGCLVELHKRATGHGKTLRIQNVPDAARRIVDIGGLSMLLDPDAS